MKDCYIILPCRSLDKVQSYGHLFLLTFFDGIEPLTPLRETMKPDRKYDLK